MGKCCLHASLFIFDQIIIKLLVTRTGIKAWKSSISGLWFPWPIYIFFEMRFDLGTLDSGERSLPFGLLVFLQIHYHLNSKTSAGFTKHQTSDNGLSHDVAHMIEGINMILICYCCFTGNSLSKWHIKIRFCCTGYAFNMSTLLPKGSAVAQW